MLLKQERTPNDITGKLLARFQQAHKYKNCHIRKGSGDRTEFRYTDI